MAGGVNVTHWLKSVLSSKNRIAWVDQTLDQVVLKTVSSVFGSEKFLKMTLLDISIIIFISNLVKTHMVWEILPFLVNHNPSIHDGIVKEVPLPKFEKGNLVVWLYGQIVTAGSSILLSLIPIDTPTFWSKRWIIENTISAKNAQNKNNTSK
jgi:phage-related holin